MLALQVLNFKLVKLSQTIKLGVAPANPSLQPSLAPDAEVLECIQRLNINKRPLIVNCANDPLRCFVIHVLANNRFAICSLVQQQTLRVWEIQDHRYVQDMFERQKLRAERVLDLVDLLEVLVISVLNNHTGARSGRRGLGRRSNCRRLDLHLLTSMAVLIVPLCTMCLHAEQHFLINMVHNEVVAALLFDSEDQVGSLVFPGPDDRRTEVVLLGIWLRK